MAKVLVVDDSVTNVKVLVRTLSNLGYELLTAYNGKQALELAESQPPDVILLDVMMPGMDGYEVCRRLKANRKLSSIPVIMVSARNLEEDVVQGLDAGAHDYITKPFNRHIATARVRSAVRGKIAYDTIQEMNSKLEESKRAAEAGSLSKGEFLANMSHEIRTPMTAILGFAESLTDRNLSESERLMAIDTIRRNGEYLLQIINDILDLSKIEAGRLDIEQIACSPRRVVEDAVSLMRVRADSKGLTFEVKYAGPIPETIRTDPARLRQILLNLVGNAIKFTETGSLRLVARFIEGQKGQRSYLQFEVIDTDLGMTPEQIVKLFQPFTQADTSTTRRFGGTGLGLTVSKRLAEMFGGDITVESEPGVGSKFTVTIGTESVDDMAMSDRLVEVTIAENGQVAVEKALAALNEGEPFDVILMDMQMPVLDGYEATKLLRSRNYTGPIIALTAHAMAGDREKCIRAGCDDYAAKPLNRAALIKMIQRYRRAAIAQSMTP
ncbi:MAG: response regulator [Phycisphaerae bacterium]